MEGFVPCPATGFQVKAEEMPPAKVVTEMRRREFIDLLLQELADQSGAYIIVSSSGLHPTVHSNDNVRRWRKQFVNFQIATLSRWTSTTARDLPWIRDHAGVILWVRERIGKSVRGWQAYGLGVSPEGPNTEYLLDDGVRVQTGRQEHADG